MGGVSFAPIPGHPGYVADSEGTVYGPRGPLTRHEGSSKGYFSVRLGSDSHGTGRRVSLHRAVLWAFAGPPPGPGYDCDHVDADPSNCRASNLRWLGARENRSRKGESNGSAKLTDEIVREIRRRRADGESGAALGREFNVSSSMVSKIVRRAAWGHVSEGAQHG